MYERINIAALERCIVNNEKAPRFCYGSYISVSPCGTAGCLVGNDMLATESCADTPLWKLNDDAPAFANHEYQLPLHIYCFLFMPSFERFVWDGARNISFYEPRSHHNIAPALNRMRKVVAYLKRKKAIWNNADGSIRDEARRTEGDLNILRAALAEAAPPCLASAV